MKHAAERFRHDDRVSAPRGTTMASPRSSNHHVVLNAYRWRGVSTEGRCVGWTCARPFHAFRVETGADGVHALPMLRAAGSREPVFDEALASQERRHDEYDGNRGCGALGQQLVAGAHVRARRDPGVEAAWP